LRPSFDVPVRPDAGSAEFDASAGLPVVRTGAAKGNADGNADVATGGVARGRGTRKEAVKAAVEGEILDEALNMA
jgi:hypothetical protein